MERVLGLIFAVTLWPFLALILLFVGPFIWVYALLRSLAFFAISMLLHAIASKRLYASASVLEADILWYPQRIKETLRLLKSFVTGARDGLDSFDEDDVDEYELAPEDNHQEQSLVGSLMHAAGKFLAFVITQLIPATLVWIGIYYTFLSIGIDLSMFITGEKKVLNIALWCSGWLIVGILGIAIMPLVRTILVVPFVFAVAVIWLFVGLVFWIPRLVVAFLDFFLKSIVYMFVSGRASSPMEVITRAFYYYLKGFFIIFSILTNNNEITKSVSENDVQSEQSRMLRSLRNSLAYLLFWIPLLGLLALKGWLPSIRSDEATVTQSRTATYEPVEETTTTAEEEERPAEAPDSSQVQRGLPQTTSQSEKANAGATKSPDALAARPTPKPGVENRNEKPPESIDGYVLAGVAIEIIDASTIIVNLSDYAKQNSLLISRGDEVVFIKGSNAHDRSLTAKVDKVYFDARFSVIPTKPIQEYQIGMTVWKRKRNQVTPLPEQNDKPNVREATVVEAVAIRRVPPQYPRRASSAGVEGRVIVRFTIDKNGLPKNAQIIFVDPSGWGFERASLDALAQWRYHPRTENGVPVETVGVESEFKFELD